MKRAFVAGVLLLFISACTEDKAPKKDIAVEAVVPAADFMSAVDAGKAAAEAHCFSCHGADGRGTSPDVPNLAGQHKDYIITASTEYQNDTRKNGVMKKNLQALTDTELANVAAYYANLPPVVGVVDGNKHGQDEVLANSEKEPVVDPVNAGAAFAPGCEGCHGEGGNSTFPGTPSLAGQPAPYTIAALRAYKEKLRTEETMVAVVQDLSDLDLEYIAAYYAVQTPLPRKVEVKVPEAAAGCGGCHGEDGNSADPFTPSMAGQDAQYLATAMKAYKVGSRNHELMKNLITPLSNVEINALASYYATQEPKAQVVVSRRSAEEWAIICERCHGAGGRSNNPRFPDLAGQQEDYLIHALEGYKKETRIVSMMHAMAWPLDEEDIRNLAKYYAGKAR